MQRQLRPLVRASGRLGLTMAVSLAIACGPPKSSRIPSAGQIGDAPYELADDSDLAQVHGQFDAAPLGPRRDQLRDKLAAEYDRRLVVASKNNDRDAAIAMFEKLASLWSAAELGRADAAVLIQRHKPAVERLYSDLARAGADRDAAAALVFLTVADPPSRAEREAELALILAFGDEQMISLYGDAARRARPITVLERVIEVVPTIAIAERLCELYVERQMALESYMRRRGADINVLRAHGRGALVTTWNLFRAFARAGNVLAALPYAKRVVGLGDAPELRKAAAAAARGDAAAWLTLAATYTTDADGDNSAPDAALAILLQATAAHKDVAALHLAAGHAAIALEKVDLAIREYQRGLSLDNSDRRASESLARLYEFRVSRLSFSDRPREAEKALAEFETFYGAAAKRWKGFSPDLADAYASMGRGKISIGDLAAAKRYLNRSLAQRKTLDAYETHGTIYLRLDQYDRALEFFDAALALPADTPNAKFDQFKILRLAGEAHHGAGRKDKARALFHKALAEWDGMLNNRTFELRPPFAAEAWTEVGKLRWAIGQMDDALLALASAIDSNPDGESTYADVVAFLVTRDRYDAALDAFHRGLGSAKVGDYYKVYMSLWLVAEARRGGRAPDPLARDFLAGRDGPLWYDQLARMASGKVASNKLTKLANTRGRRAELLYYEAVLDRATKDPASARELLEQVIATDMVLFFEYEMAKYWLTHGLGQ